MSLTPGAWLATINSLSPGWLIASLPQADAGLVGRRARVVATLPDYRDRPPPVIGVQVGRLEACIG